jgi:hypothetical protein
VAKRITVDTQPVVQFEGLIESIAFDRWVVAGQEVLIDQNTRIEGTPAIGSIAKVEGVVRADNAKVARRIRIEAIVPPPATPVPPSPTPTLVRPTATATAVAPTSTATPVAPTATAMSPVPPSATPLPTSTRAVAAITATATAMMLPSATAGAATLSTSTPQAMSDPATPPMKR